MVATTARAPLLAALLVVGTRASGQVWDASPVNSTSAELLAVQAVEDLDAGPGVVNIAVAVALSLLLLSGLARVFRVLQKLDIMRFALRNVPEGMRTAKCGACNITQCVSTHGRIFICFGCSSANRIPQDLVLHREQLQLLVAHTGPLRAYEFRKGGYNYWQELRREELPLLLEAEAIVDPEKLHYRSAFCLACSKDACVRLSEFPPEALVANLPPQAGVETNAQEATDALLVEPAVIGRPQEGVDLETMSNRSSTNYNGYSQCVVCLDKAGCMVLLPCAHGSVCEECATRIAQNRASGGAHCPHCRSGIETLVKLHQVAGDLARGVEVRIAIARAV